MERELTVHISRRGETTLVGHLWTRSRGARESASFEYAAAWLARPDRFAIDPELPLTAGAFHTERPVFNVFTDPAPDRWGQTLLRRSERARARAEGRSPRTLTSVDFSTRCRSTYAHAFTRSRSTRRIPLLRSTMRGRSPGRSA